MNIENWKSSKDKPGILLLSVSLGTDSLLSLFTCTFESFFFFPVQTNCLFLSTCVLKVDHPRMGDGTLECSSLQFQGLHLANSDFLGSLCQYLSIAQLIITIFKSKHNVRWQLVVLSLGSIEEDLIGIFITLPLLASA